MSNALPQTYVWLRPPPQVSRALDVHRRRWWWPRGARLPAVHRLHMTLHPLGVLDDARIQAVAEALQRIRFPSFQFELDWTGVWTRNGIAVACAAPDAAVAQLHDACARALGSSLRSGAWMPHVTLARDALGAGAELIEPLRWPVDAFWLVRSWILPRASRHEVLRCYPLPGAATESIESNPCAAHGLPGRLWSAPPLGLR